MRIVCISDTHGTHRNLQVPEGDMIIHAGDVTGRGTKIQVMDFLDWFEQLDICHKVFIAGNHDFYFEKADPNEIQQILPDNIIYLNDSGINIEGLNIWGSPIQPWFYDWAFNRKRGAEIRTHWDKIPAQSDLIITHGPAYGILDTTIRNEAVGCKDLLKKIQQIQPRIHISGHIHEAYGRVNRNGVEFVNASVLDERYRMKNAPIVLDV